jgi:hypothetical protein
MKISFKLIIAASCFSLLLRSQTNAVNTSSDSPNIPRRGCGTAVPSPEWDAWFNSKVEEYKTNKANGKIQLSSVTIPVVVHVIHGGQAVGTFPNISQAQVKSQIAVMNKDYAGIGYNTYQLANTGFSVVGAANCNITFCLAQLDPTGTPLAEPGIDRVNYNSQSWSNPASFTSQSNFQSYIDGTIKPNTIWDPTYYFNIWVTDVNSGVGLLGYSTFPGGSGLVGLPSAGGAGDDGIWVWSKSFGSTGTLQSPYTLGRTATHETGHYFGLRHVGGDGNGNAAGDCNATDYCNDTPPQKGGYQGGQYGQNFGGPSYPLHVNTCAPNDPYGDMFMNFMDYSDDAYCYMFTPDQNTRIQTALANGYFRNQLSASSATLCSGLPLADFVLDTVVCFNSAVSPLNQTSGSATLTYSWSVSPNTGVAFAPSSTDQNPAITFPSAGFYTLTVVASNSIGVNSSNMVLKLEDCTGIKENTGLEKNISLAPNPTSGKVFIKSELPAGQYIEVTIHNSLGQLIISKHYSDAGNNTFTIDMNACTDGVYTVSISNGRERIVKRLILNK